MNAVFNLPEKPNPCKATLRAFSVPRHITCVTRKLASPVAFLHLARDQACRHVPLGHFPASTNHFKPLAKMGRETQRSTSSNHRW
jgi:hypothetical protein